MKSIQKVVLNGRSAQVTIIRQFLFAMNLRPGDLVECETTETGELHIRPFRNTDTPRMHPAVAPAASPLESRR